ncbi:DUF4468 domain-containing protein [Spirosoma sp. HMF3257]|uniref:DUF4468 domain-containing protein n=1 Tax=Spirosoma telluris TaxID=2183553 RepID=A0A327NMB0_9BACT|nr:DUF4468 domain-containing protein [Spirosoma telluris]RAI75034.1 hypothetical protein HMF3257_13840 [Spirosoma telluris]
MNSVFLVALIASLFCIGTVRADCPPVLTNGKLHGILPVTNQAVTYTEVVDCGPASQADLFRRARLWLTQSFHSPTDNFALSDKETGDLVGRVTQVVTLPRSESSAGGVYTFRYSFVVECTNRKYRATITQITFEDGARSASIETYCQKNEKDLQVLYSELDKQLKTTLASLQENVKNYKAF